MVKESIVSTRIPTELFRMFEEICQTNHMSVSQTIRAMVDHIVRKNPTDILSPIPEVKISEETVITKILLTHRFGDDLDGVLMRVAAENKLKIEYVYHCYGVLVLHGTRL